MQKPYTLPASTVLQRLDTDKFKGLTKREARHRLALHGPNSLKKHESTSLWQLLGRQLDSPLVWILILAAVLAFIAGEYVDVVVVLLVVILNSIIGLVQEYKAQKAIAELHNILAPQARVLREGQEQKILATELVVGDIVLLEAGDIAPADVRIVECRNLRANQASLTGESIPVEKKADVILEGTTLSDRKNTVYQSSVVISGTAVTVVVAIGMSTELGLIAEEVNRVESKASPLTTAVAKLGQYLIGIAAILSLIVLVIGYIQGTPLIQIAGISISLLVSLVPEGLPIVLTVILSVALMKIYKQKALVRKLSASEALGSVDTICLDKTGTLSEGTMTVEKMYVAGNEYAVEGNGYGLSGSFFTGGKKVDITKRPAARLMLELASLSTMSTISKNDLLADLAKSLTDPTETALAVVAAKAGFYAFRGEGQHPELLEIPFDQELRFSTSVHRFDKENRYIVKGAAEKILQLSTHVVSENGQVRGLFQETRTKLEEQMASYASQGYRIAALGYVDRNLKEAVNHHHIKSLTFVGFFCLDDPIRVEAAEAIKRAYGAGLRVIMITGDHLLTAQAVARKLGLLEYGKAIHASELQHVQLKEVSVVARATPRDKLLIIERLQKSGSVVAMTGDGINDAPALKKADIGIAMGRIGTDAAVGASDLVLLDDGLDSIITAVREGRLIVQNVRKAVFHLIATNAAEAMLVIVALLMRLPLPLLAVQILWMNLVTDGITSMAFTTEGQELGGSEMKRPDRQPLFDWADARRLILLSGVMTIGTVLVYRDFLPQGEDFARTAALTTMVLFQLFNLFNSRSQTLSAFSPRLRVNHLLDVVFLTAVALQLFAVYSPLTQRFLHTTLLDWYSFSICLLVACTVVVVDEIRKVSATIALSWAYNQKPASQ